MAAAGGVEAVVPEGVSVDHAGGGHTTRYAVIIAVFYFALAGSYISASDWIARQLATSVEALSRIEVMKGWTFVTVTSLALFFWSRFILRLAQREITRRAEILRVLDSRALAGTMAAAVAHDGNNALAVVKANATILVRSGHLKGEDAEVAGDLMEAVDRLVAMMRRLRDLGHQGRALIASEFDLKVEVEEALTRLRKHPKVQLCTVRYTAPAPVPMSGYPILIEQIVTNLVLNAADAQHGHGLIEVSVTNGEAGPVLSVADSGPGIPEAMQAMLFQPFFTTKSDGTGLGLLSIKACAEDHQGHVAVSRSASGGARFDVFLPGLDATAPEVSAALIRDGA